MDPLTLGILGGVGALGSIGGSLIGSSASRDAANVQKNMAMKSIVEQQAAGQTAQALQQPYQNIGAAATPILQYLLTGSMPNVQALSPEEQALMQDLSGQQNALITRRSQLAASTTGNRSKQRQYAQEMTRIDEKLRQLSDLQNRNQVSTTFNQFMQGGGVQATPMYRWQQQEGENALNRRLSAMGRGNSTFGANAFTDFQRGLGAQATQDLIGNLMNASNIGRGAATQQGANAINLGNAMTGILGNVGANQANAINQQGQQQASLYSNLGALPMQLYGAYQRINAAG